MQPYNLKHKYGVVRFVGSVQCHGREELVFQSDDAAQTMEQLVKECLKDGAAHHHKIIVKDGNS